MKYITLLFIMISFSLHAQVEVNFLTAPYSVNAKSKFLIPLGLELKPSDRWSLYSEIGLPILLNSEEVANTTMVNVKVQLRAYSQKKTKNNFEIYLAFEIDHLALYYSKIGSNYLNELGNRIVFGRADVGNVVNSLNIKMGSRRVSKKRFIFDWNLGFGFSQQTVRYYNISPPTNLPVFTVGSDIFDPLLSTFYHRDTEAGSYVIPSLRGSIRIGYRLSKGTRQSRK